jgi:hypothetical protein
MPPLAQIRNKIPMLLLSVLTVLQSFPPFPSTMMLAFNQSPNPVLVHHAAPLLSDKAAVLLDISGNSL